MLAIVGLMSGCGFIVTQVTDVALETSLTGSTIVTRHVRSTTVDARLIDLTALRRLFAIQIVGMIFHVDTPTVAVGCHAAIRSCDDNRRDIEGCISADDGAV